MAKRASPGPGIKRLADLTPDAENLNQHTPRGAKLMEASLQECGFGDSLTVDKDGAVISGNQRLETLASLRMDNPIVVQSDGTRPIVHQRTDLAIGDVRAKQLAIYQNRVGEANLAWNLERLKQLRVDVPDVDLGRYWTEKELKALLGDGGAGSPEDDRAEALVERAEELQKEWKTAAGQLWLIPSKTVSGRNHRVLCGDAGDAAAVERVLAGATVALMVSDPPYGVAYNAGGSKIANDNLGAGQEEFWRKAYAAWPLEGDAYVFAPAGPLNMKLASALAAAGITHEQWLIWVKNALVLSRGHYHYRHEHIFYGWRGASSWLAGSDRDSVWNCARPTRSAEHPTMKPTELYARAMMNSSLPGATVVDPFMGSGTLLVAAEQLGRIAAGTELAPKYVAVILQRASDIGLAPGRLA